MSDIPSWIGARVGDRVGSLAGVVEDVYHGERTSCPAWLLVRVAAPGDRLVLVPTDGALTWSGSVVVPFDRELIEASPTVANPPPVLTGEPVCRLARHYGVRVDRSASFAAVHGGVRAVRAA